MFVEAGAARSATAVVYEHVVSLLISISTTFPRSVIGKSSKGGTRGSDVRKGERRALAMEGGSREKEERRAENWIGIEVQIVTRGDGNDV